MAGIVAALNKVGGARTRTFFNLAECYLLHSSLEAFFGLKNASN